jgi:hypothetical protein
MGQPARAHSAAASDPDGRRGRGAPWGVGRILVVVGVLALATIVAGLAILAATRLSGLGINDPWRDVAQDVLKTAYQALILGALGGLLKIWIDQARQVTSEQRELVRIRTELVDGVVHCSHQLDTGRTLLRANLATLSDVMTDIVIPARVQLREISHDLRTWHDADVPVLNHNAFRAATFYLNRQIRYTDDLLDEYATHKQDLGELLWHAEQAKTPTAGARSEEDRDAADAASRARRQAALVVVKQALEQLAKIRDYTDGTGDYGEFRSFYVKTITTLRRTLQSGRLPTLPDDVPTGWTGIPKATDAEKVDGPAASTRQVRSTLTEVRPTSH